MSMTRTRRFRDMSLTEEEAEAIMYNHPDFFARHDIYFERENPETGEIEVTENRGAIIVARAKRLLPLWRKWGLRELFDRGFARGSEAWGGFHG